MAFEPRPTFNTWNRGQQIGLALDQPFTFGQTFTENLQQGILDSFGLGSAVREFAAPDRVERITDADRLRVIQGGRVSSAELDQRFTAATLTKDQYETSPYFRAAIPWEQGMTEDRAASLSAMYDKKQVREHFSQKQPVAAFLGQLVGQALDPINYVPVFGEGVQAAAIAKMGSIGGRLLLSASEAAVNTAAFGITTASIRKKFGDDVSFESIASDIAMSALIGGIFGAGAGVIMRGADQRAMAVARARPKLETLGNTMEARAALNDAVTGIVDRAEVELTPNSLATIEKMADEITARTSGVRALRDETAGVTGSKAGEVAISPSGARVNVRPEVVELSSLVRATGNLQVRDRTSAASAAQVEDIALNLDPARLMPNVDASQGAPLVGPDNIIDSGNGRTMGIQRAYEAYPEKAAAYRQALVDAGYADAAGMQQPVLINRRLTPLTETARAQFNGDLNGPTTARMSAVELAAMDRQALTDPVLDVMDDAPVTAAGNRAFVQRFLANLPQNERGALLERDGVSLSADGARRIENALVAAAYGDVDAGIVRRFAEATDDNTRSIVGALSDVAGTWTRMRGAIKRQEIGAEFDLTPELTQALRLLSKWRDQAAGEGRAVGTVIREGLAQLDLLNGGVSPEAQTFIRMFYENDHFGRAVGRDKLAARLRTVADSTIELGRPSLFGDTLVPTKGEVLTNAQRDEADAFAADGLEPRPAQDSGAGEGSAAERIGGADRSGIEGRSIAAVMTDRFAAAGRPADEAAAAAQIVDAFYTTMAQRLGMTADELTRRFGLPDVVRGGELDGGALAQSMRSTDTPEFKTWFGDSKVVDAEGKPLVVYHGTDQNFEAFDADADGIEGVFFSSSPSIASGYANPFWREGGESQSVIPTFLSLQKPMVIDWQKTVAKNGGEGALFDADLLNDIVSMAQDRGHDGLIVRGIKDGADLGGGELADTYIAFRPEQIKSVNNRGTFDASDPRILFQPAYHGTRHVFDRFEWSDATRGKGEGAQAFGDGLYFAGNKEVAKYYRETLTQTKATVKLDGVEFDGAIRADGGAVNVQDYALSMVRIYGGVDEAIDVMSSRSPNTEARAKQINDSVDWLEANRDRVEVQKSPGRLYKVDIPDDSELMDWDKPLAEQSPAVREKMAALGFEERKASEWKPREGSAGDRPIIIDQYGSEIVQNEDGTYSAFGKGPDGRSARVDYRVTLERAKQAIDRFNREDSAPTGEQMYRELSKRLRATAEEPALGWASVGTASAGNNFGGDRAASAALREIGIPGHRFLDQGSRAGREWRIQEVKGADGETRYQPVDQDGNTGVPYAFREDADKFIAQNKLTHNYVIYDDSRVSITDFEQQGARGAIDLNANVIRLFEQADASTALHESGHLFLGMYKRIADDATAPSALRAEWDAIKRWWSGNAGDVARDANASGRAEGVTDADVRKVLAEGTSGDKAKDLAIDVGLHEQWARAFEAYVREGEAPSSGLRGVFEQFKRWLTDLYKQAKDLNVTLNDDIRAVFDRMLTMEPVARDEPSLGLEPSPSKPQARVDGAAPKPDPVPDGLPEAEARVGKSEDLAQLADVHGVKEDGSYTEQLEIDQMREEGRLTPEDEAELDAAEQLYNDADAWAKSLEVAGRCMI